MFTFSTFNISLCLTVDRFGSIYSTEPPYIRIYSIKGKYFSNIFTNADTSNAGCAVVTQNGTLIVPDNQYSTLNIFQIDDYAPPLDTSFISSISSFKPIGNSDATKAIIIGTVSGSIIIIASGIIFFYFLRRHQNKQKRISTSELQNSTPFQSNPSQLSSYTTTI